MSWVERLMYATILDDRGMRKRVCMSDLLPLGDVHSRREFQRLLLRERRGVLIAWIALLALILAFMIWRGPFAGGATGYFAAVVLMLAALPISWWFDGVRKQSLRHSRLSRELCPACGYGIRGVPAKADGLTTCPECAAAWKVNR